MSVAITWVTPHPEGRWLAVGDADGRLLVWAPAENRIVAQRKLDKRVRRAEWTFDGALLLVIAEDGDVLHVLSPDGADVVRTIETGHGVVYGLAAHPSKRWAATTGDDARIRIWDLDRGAAVLELKASGDGSVCALSEEYVAVGTFRGAFDVWEIATKKDKAGGEVFGGTYVSAIAFSPDGKSLLMGGGKGKLLRFETGGKWTCAHEWKDHPPPPIATNDIRYRDDTTWIAAHSDDRAALFQKIADLTPTDLGTPFWAEKKPWNEEYIVSSACFVPGTDAIVTAHFSGRLRVFADKNGQWLRAGDVIFDPGTGTPKAFGPIGDALVVTKVPAAKKRGVVAVTIGDRNRRVRTLEEAELAVSFHPCPKCGAIPAGLVPSGEGNEVAVLSGPCRFCGKPLEFRFFSAADLPKAGPERHQIADAHPTAIIEPRTLTAELERLTEIGIDDGNRDRALTCIIELLKFPLIRDGERGGPLRAERDRLLADVKPLPAVQKKEAPANIDTICRALFLSATPPTSLGQIEKILGVRAEIDPTRVSPSRTSEVALTGFVKKVAVQPNWDIYHQRGPENAEALRGFPLVEWSVIFAGGAEVFQQALRRAHGPPDVRPSCHVYGKRWVVRTRGPEIELTWAQRIPDWAMNVDPNLRERALAALAIAVTAARGGGELQAAVAKVAAGAGIELRDSGSSSVSLTFAPPMKILELARIFGWPEIVGRTHDIHGATIYVELPAGGSPRLGPWPVSLITEGGPTGGGLDEKVAYHLWTWRFGPDDLVRYWSIGGS